MIALIVLVGVICVLLVKVLDEVVNLRHRVKRLEEKKDE